jgi:hypothetical protein
MHPGAMVAQVHNFHKVTIKASHFCMKKEKIFMGFGRARADNKPVEFICF